MADRREHKKACAGMVHISLVSVRTLMARQDFGQTDGANVQKPPTEQLNLRQAPIGVQTGTPIATSMTLVAPAAVRLNN